ncbi:MAG TPA: M1 family aminopeptidase [Methylomirabilota bacterium]|nr:M1 family aminopeptidase [Methylomirabilota bacterium]
MNIDARILSCALCVCLVWPSSPGHAEGESIEYCRHVGAHLAPPDSSDHRKYAPDREIDILHFALDVTPDWTNRAVAGTATLQFKPIAQPLEELQLDGIDLEVEAVSATEKLLGYHASATHVFLTFATPVPPGRETTVTIRYRATPDKGLYFRTPEMGYPEGDTHIWTQGEPIEARHWFPCYDAPNEKFTTEITCRVPEGMVVRANGRLMSETRDAATGLTAVRWLQDKPHVNYLICLVAGYLKKIEDKYKDIPLAFYTPASLIDTATNSFKDTKDMMAFFEAEIGVPYPWAKYDQIVVNDFTAGGMENTSITVLTENTLHTSDYEQLRSSQGLVAHELAHQWFGDLVTCKDWSHLWLNEGFATYYDALYEGHKNGRDAMLYVLYESARGITSHPDQTNAIVRRDFNRPEDQFGYLAYPKGSWILHMLRSRLGPDLYRQCVKTYLERHAYGVVVTEDLNAVIEELSGRSWDQFFDQYVYHASQPTLNVSYSWDERSKLAKVSVTQAQRLSERVLLFNVPLPVRFKTKDGVVERTLEVKEKSEDFYIPLPAAPEIVRIDPDLTVLATINFSPPTPMLNAQLADKSDMLGRLIAVEKLGERKDAGSVPKLKEVLNHDPFYGVRLAASRALRAVGNDAAYEALRSSLKQPDARVRDRVANDILSFYRESTYAVALDLARNEKNPGIRADAIRALGAYTQPQTREILLAALRSDSYQHALASAAIGGMRNQDDAAYIDPLLAALKQEEAKFTSSGFGGGLETLAYLARNEDKKDAVREFLASHVNSRKRRVQLAAIRALGILGDPKAIAVLETFSLATKDSPERTAAERAVGDLRASRKPGADLGTLRSEVLSLQRENRDLRKDLDDLKKKLEALMPKPTADKEMRKPAPKKAEKR